MKKKILLLILTLLPIVARAYDACIDGIYYKFDQTTKTATVTNNYRGNYRGTVNIPSVVNYNGDAYTVTNIGVQAFANCSGLTSVTIPNSVTSIGAEAFNGCSGLTSVVIPNSVTLIGNLAFNGCSGLTSITIPNSVTTIEAKAFSGTGWYNNQPDGFLYLDTWLIGYKGEKPIGNIVIDERTKRIADKAFSDCSGLTSVIIPNSATSIGNWAFTGCSGLTSVTIPNSVTSINEGTFCGCSGLISVAIPNNVTSIGDQAFDGCSSLTSVTIPNSVTTIGGSAFVDCSGLISVNIPNSVTSIGDGAFSRCSSLFSMIIPNSVTTIGGNTFSNCTSLNSITIPNSVTSIGDRAFSYCNSLTTVTIPNNVTSIGDGAFSYCSGLTSVTIPNSVTSIGDQAFADCSSLTSVIIPNSVTSLGKHTFMKCSGLISVTISNNMTSIASGTFERCSGLTYVTIPNSVKSIGEYAFKGCSSLISVTIPNSVTSIDEYAFSGCSSLTALTLPEELRIIKRNTFDGCKSLKGLIIPAKIEVIYQEAFAGCYNIESVKSHPETPPFLYDNSFSDFSVPLKVPKGCKKTYQNAQGWKNFTNISDADKYKLTYMVDGDEYKSYEIEEGTNITPESAPTKEGYTFSGWSEIPQTMPAKDVTVTGTFTINKYKLVYKVDGEVYKTYEIEYGKAITPEAAPTKEGYTFSGWSEIPATMPAHDVEITGTFTQVEFVIDDVTYEISGEGTVTIKGSDQKDEVTIDATVVINGQTYRVTAIADNAFKENQSITSVTIPDGINTIGDNAFNGCIGLIVINIGKDVQSIGNKAFANVGTASAARTRSEEGMLIVNCYAESVPQTATDAFENTPIENGTLMVEDNSVNAYKATSPWSGFGRILGFDEAAGINTVSIDSPNARIYDMQGNRLDNPQKGVNIIRYKDGKVKKVMVK